VGEEAGWRREGEYKSKGYESLSAHSSSSGTAGTQNTSIQQSPSSQLTAHSTQLTAHKRSPLPLPYTTGHTHSESHYTPIIVCCGHERALPCSDGTATHFHLHCPDERMRGEREEILYLQWQQAESAVNVQSEEAVPLDVRGFHGESTGKGRKKDEKPNGHCLRTRRSDVPRARRHC
jgi:hypothetical protein